VSSPGIGATICRAVGYGNIEHSSLSPRCCDSCEQAYGDYSTPAESKMYSGIGAKTDSKHEAELQDLYTTIADRYDSDRDAGLGMTNAGL
jgi:hypothetical protein